MRSAQTARNDARARGANQGMNWIRQEKRLAIYLRDGLACVYCGQAVEDGVTMTLDHVIPHSKGGSNESVNLVTCCQRCNSSRGNRPLGAWSKAVAAYLDHGVTAREISDHVTLSVTRPIDLNQAKQLIARRGSAARVLAQSARRR